MLLYFDTKDLIDILENSKPFSSNKLEKILQKGDHNLVFSFISIMEISEPLLHSKSKTNVMGLLNRLEQLPHVFLHESSIPRLELEEAFRAYSNGEEYRNIRPFVNRFDETVDLNASPATKIFLKYSMAETVWDLFCEDSLGGLDIYVKKLRQAFADDRALNAKPSLKENFIKTVQLNIITNKAKGFSGYLRDFSKWVYSNPLRCPSIRLGYEIWHKMVRNVTDEPEDSDLEDFQHIGCLPYVDLMTLDRRMYGYVVNGKIKVYQFWEDKNVPPNWEFHVSNPADSISLAC